MIVKDYHAEPTLARFHQERAFFQYVEGPFGSGKSTGMVMEIMRRAMNQKPNQEGRRQSRVAVVRSTYPQLKATTIKTWQMWVPDAIAPVVYGTPITSRLKQRLGDGTILDLEVIFLALDRPEDVEKLTSLELSFVYINEAREVDEVIVNTLAGRVDRFPAYKDGGVTEPGIIADSNPPMMTHWLYVLFMNGERVTTEIEGLNGEKHKILNVKYTQPPAVYFDEVEQKWRLNPDAENLKNLSPMYYVNQLAQAKNDENFIKVNLGGQPGMSRKGKPIFPQFSIHKHVAKEKLNPQRGLPIIIGFDFGLNPAAIFCQLTHRGLRVLDELPPADESLEDFCDQYVLPLLQKRYPGFQIIGSGDPAGRGRSGLDKRTPFDVLITRGIKAFPAQTNNFITRKETVDYFLGRDEGLIVSPHCTVVIEGFSSGYVYKEARMATGGKILEVADKNEWSHPMDAVQYAALQAKYGLNPIGRKATKEPRKKHLWA